MKKFIQTVILCILIMCNCYTAFAKETNDGNSDTGQVMITYTSSKKPSTEVIEKGDGTLDPNPDTGDTGIGMYLELMVISLAILLMLIIYIEKGENRNEKDEIYEFSGCNSLD